MNTRTRFVWICLLWGLSSCNSFVDKQPEPDKGPPQGTVQSLFAVYPQAEGIRFTTILDNRLWLADFTQHQLHYQALTAPAQLLTTDQLLDGKLPDSLSRSLETSSFPGGTIARPRFHLWQNDWSAPVSPNDLAAYVLADYTWQQQLYTAYWTVSGRGTTRSWFNLAITPYLRASYSTRLLADLPEPIQARLRDMTFLFAQIQIDNSGQATYTVSASQQNQFYNLLFDKDGQAIAVRNQMTAQLFRDSTQLPSAVQSYLQLPELTGFGLGKSGSYYRHTYGSLITYEMTLEKGKEAWDLRFSEKGQLISRTYRLYGEF